MFTVCMLLSVPASLTNVSADQTVSEGSSIQLWCEATGQPTPNSTWNRVLEDGSNSEVLHQGPTWDFPNISRTASGTYRCTAHNGFGNPVDHQVKVNVTCKYFTCLKPTSSGNEVGPKHCLWTGGMHLWFNNQSITVHNLYVPGLSASCIHCIKDPIVQLGFSIMSVIKYLAKNLGFYMYV